MASASTGNPINVTNGNKYEREEDLSPLPGKLGMEFVRHYNSQTTYQGAIGYGWSHSYDVQFNVVDDHHITLRQADGRVLYFEKQKSGDYIAQQAADGHLKKVSEGYDWKWFSGRTLQFTEKGQLQRIVSATGQVTQLYYTADRKLIKIIDPQDRRISLAYNNKGYLVELTDPGNAKYHYVYDQKGNLEKVIYPDKSTRVYHYEDQYDPHNLTGLTDQRGIRFATWRYDDQDRAILSTHANGVQKVTLKFEKGKTLVTNSKGVTSTYTIGMVNHVPVVERVDGPGCSSCGTGDIEYVYNNHVQIRRILTQDGKDTINRYDASGRIVSQIWKNIGVQRASVQYVYKDGTRPYRVIKPSINPKKQHVATIVYNNLGQVEKITETGYLPRGNGKYLRIVRQVNLTYEKGRLLSIDGPRNDVSDVIRFQYDDLGRLIKVVQPDGHSSEILEYDEHGRPTKLRIGAGPVVSVAYDIAGNIEQMTRAAQKVKVRYDGVGRMTKIIREDGQMYTISYDGAGRRKSISDNQGNKIGYIWNTEEQLISQYVQDKTGKVLSAVLRLIDKQGKIWGVMTPEGIQSIQGYNKRGKPLISANGNAKGDYFIRNKRGQLLATMAADNGVTRYLADRKGRISLIQDPIGRATIHLYDDFGNLVLERSPDTGITRYRYDLSGNLVERTDTEGQKTIYKYNAAGKLVELKNKDRKTRFEYKSGHLVQILNGANGESYEYNDMGQLVAHHRVIDDKKFTTEYRYSEATGQLIEKTLPGGEVIEYQYKANQGRLSYIGLKKWFIHQPILSDIHYQPFGQRTGYTQQNGIRTEFKYDRAGRITKLVSKDVGKLEYRYDAAGNIVGIYRNKSRENYQYDPTGRLIKADTITGSHTYQYDTIGNRKHDGLQKVSYDAKHT